MRLKGESFATSPCVARGSLVCLRPCWQCRSCRHAHLLLEQLCAVQIRRYYPAHSQRLSSEVLTTHADDGWCSAFIFRYSQAARWQQHDDIVQRPASAPVLESLVLGQVHRHEAEAAAPHWHDRLGGRQHQEVYAHFRQHAQQSLRRASDAWRPAYPVKGRRTPDNWKLMTKTPCLTSAAPQAMCLTLTPTPGSEASYLYFMSGCVNISITHLDKPPQVSLPAVPCAKQRTDFRPQ